VHMHDELLLKPLARGRGGESPQPPVDRASAAANKVSLFSFFLNCMCMRELTCEIRQK